MKKATILVTMIVLMISMEATADCSMITSCKDGGNVYCSGSSCSSNGSSVTCDGCTSSCQQK